MFIFFGTCQQSGSDSHAHAHAADPNQTRDQLRATFDKFDTSGDGFLDADELRIALRFRALTHLPHMQIPVCLV